MAWNLKDLENTLLIGSTLVEGSTLTEREARQILAGKTIQGHPVHEIRELLNYRAAVAWLMKEVEASPFISVDMLRQFHQQLFHGFPGVQGEWKTHRNYTFHADGKRHDYLTPSKVTAAVAAWVGQFNGDTKATRFTKEKAADFAARLYYDFQEIHPFEDGNGRIGRIFISYWLHWKAKLSWRFQLKDKTAHLQALEAANSGNHAPLMEFFHKRLTKG